jgi:hypothetical protein
MDRASQREEGRVRSVRSLRVCGRPLKKPWMGGLYAHIPSQSTIGQKDVSWRPKHSKLEPDSCLAKGIEIAS